MSVFRTVLGDVDSQNMGITYAHEHIMIDESYVSQFDPTFLLNDVAKISSELASVKKLGLQSLVDTMPCACGRNPLKIKEISQQSGVQVIACTGVHLDKYYLPGHWSHNYSVEEMSNLFVADIEEGIDLYDYTGPFVKRSDVKAGIIKFATEASTFTAREERMIAAVVKAHKITGAPILTHTTNGKMALEQVDRLIKYGADLSHCVLSHVDRQPDLSYHKEVLQSDISLEYDGLFRWKDTNHSHNLLRELLSEFPDQLMVAMDAARNTYWENYGGKPGMKYLLTDFVSWLHKENLDNYFDKIFITTPQRVFSLKE